MTIATSRIPLWLASEQEYPGRHLSTTRENPDTQLALLPAPQPHPHPLLSALRAHKRVQVPGEPALLWGSSRPCRDGLGVSEIPPQPSARRPVSDTLRRARTQGKSAPLEIDSARTDRSS